MCSSAAYVSDLLSAIPHAENKSRRLLLFTIVVMSISFSPKCDDEIGGTSRSIDENGGCVTKGPLAATAALGDEGTFNVKVNVGN